MRLASGILLLSLLTALPLSAQLSGRISGSVVDASEAAVPGAQVHLILAGGERPLLSAITAADGVYRLIAVRPAEYDITVEAKGFLKTTLRGIIVNGARETSVPEVKLQLAAVSQSVEVSASTQGVDFTSAEISSTIDLENIKNLPILDRDVLSVLQTQPGVAYNGNSTTVINGLRTSYSNVTLDGVNVQDNYIRDNALDYLPNKLLMGQVDQMTVVSSNANSAATGGATQTELTTRSGGNLLHGTLFWQNRNNRFSASDWFNNQAGVAKPFLNQNQFGASLGGPIKKDKLFFYGNYEAVRARRQFPRLAGVLTAGARAGIYNYVDAGGALRSTNLLAMRGLTSVDPTVQSLLDQTPQPDRINSSDTGDLRNIGGYRFNQRGNQTRDNLTGKIDFNLSTKHVISGSYAYNHDDSDRPDAANGLNAIPQVYNPTRANFVSTSWRWTPSPNLTNNLHAGFNLTYSYFNNLQDSAPFLVSGLAFSNPVNSFQTQGRDTDTFNFSDDADWQRGRHHIQFGFKAQNVRVRTYAADGVIPTYSLGMGLGQQALTRANLPGISTNDLAIANRLLATLGGYIDSYQRTFNITSRSSGFVEGAPYIRNLRLDEYSFYVQDKWRMLPRLTVTLGLQYYLPGVADERDSLQLQPVLRGSAVDTLLSNATLDYSGKSAGRPWYNRSTKNFAPNVGFSWDVTGRGRTALRGSYSIHYVNDQDLLSTERMLYYNGGLRGNVFRTSLSDRLINRPQIAAPAFRVPRTASDNYALDPTSPLAMNDPNLHRAYVQEYSFGIQHEFKGTVFEARYVGNHAVGQYRSIDFNQVEVVRNGFLPDFLRAQNNGFLAAASTGVFNPAYNAAIPGSQPLTVFPNLAQGGYLSDPNVQYYLQTGEVGSLGELYQVYGINGSVNFFANPNALAAAMLTNYSSSSYNSLQLQALHRRKSGLSFAVNYTFSKVLSDADGDLQDRFQEFLDLNNPKLERSRTNFDQTHMFKAYGFYELPFGKGRRLNYGPLERLIGGWQLNGFVIWQSGAPFSILSGRGTLNRGARSYYNTATTSLTKDQLNDVVKFEMTGYGPTMISQSATNRIDGTGVNADGDEPFQGQVFYNPTAGNLGVLQRRRFSGPWTFTTNMSLVKSVSINDRHKVDLRMDAFNAPNHPTFWVGNQNINSQTFGAIFYQLFSPRIVQFGLTYNF